MKANDFASKSEKVHWGTVVFKDTRVPIKRIVNHLKGNYTIDGTLVQFPGVGRDQVEAFLDWALEAAENELADEEVVHNAHTS